MGLIIKNGISYGGGGGSTEVDLTRAEYDALPDTKLTDGITYNITDEDIDRINVVDDLLTIKSSAKAGDAAGTLAVKELSETIKGFGEKLYGVGNTSEIFDIPNIEKYTVIAVHISYAADSVIFLVKNENGNFYGTGSYYTAGTTAPTAFKLMRNNTAKGWSVNGAGVETTSVTIKGVYGLF